MYTILVLNPKGGSGKSTLATNLAGFFANWGVQVTIADFDPQQSALEWLKARPIDAPKVRGVVGSEQRVRVSSLSDYLIIDVASGQYGESVLKWVSMADKVIVPVLPSPHDIRAAKHFLDWVATEERMQPHVEKFAIVANKVRKNNRSFQLLKSFLLSVPFSCIAILRDTQNYVLAAEEGYSIFELRRTRVAKDLDQWQGIVRWLCFDPHLYPGVPVLQE